MGLLWEKSPYSFGNVLQIPKEGNLVEMDGSCKIAEPFGGNTI